MRRIIDLLFLLCLSTCVLVSCSKDSGEPEVARLESGDSLKLSLNVEVSVDNAALRAIDYKLGHNAKGQLVPMPQFAHNQEVEVHTFISNTLRGLVAAKTLKWRYDAHRKMLILAPTDRDNLANDKNSMTIPRFTPFLEGSGDEWYISGMIGGTLDDFRVRFEGTRILMASDSEGDLMGSLEVPYYLPNTMLYLGDEVDSSGSRKRAFMHHSSKDANFRPLGSLIAYRLGNNQQGGAYTFNPTGLTVVTTAFGDRGSFNFDEEGTALALPRWHEPREYQTATLSYSFAPGHEPGVLQHNSVSEKTYYAWVMSNYYIPEEPSTTVFLRGESSRLEGGNHTTHYTKLWGTDYRIQNKQERRLRDGKIYTMRANATVPLFLPIEYVADYDLVGGEGFASEGGTLRFANSYANNASSLYSGYRALGVRDNIHNPEGKSLQAEVDKVFGAGKYTIPTIGQWSGVFPLPELGWDAATGFDSEEFFSLDLNATSFSASTQAHYSRAYQAADRTVVYAIRFGALEYSEKYPSVANLQHNLFRSAYRFTRMGSLDEWGYSGKISNTVSKSVIVDAVYLGEEEKQTYLGHITNSKWWDDMKAKGLVITKTFPARFSDQMRYISSSYSSSSMQVPRTHYTEFYAERVPLQSAFPVRLFRKY